jgi:hypothetical protein
MGRSPRIVTEATITCPACGHRKRETMPLDACQYLYNCEACGELLRPERGHCCVFCSYADSVCPPKQRAA